MSSERPDPLAKVDVAAVRAAIALLQAAIGDEPEWLTTAQAAQRLGISRDTLDRMAGEVAEVGRDWPGAPVDVGAGRQRSLRWDAAHLSAWMRRYGSWVAEGRPGLGGPGRAPRTGRGGSGSLYARAKARKG